jgi:hypothetical protein
MGNRSRSIGGSALLFSLLAFVYGGLCIYSARQDTIIAKNEATTTGQAYLHPQGKDPNIFDTFRCDYHFNLNQVPYTGHGICPRQTDHSVKGAVENLAGLLQDQRVTVYYDPADPSTNSMMEYGAKSAYDNKKANLSMLVGVLLLLGVGVVYIAGGNKAGQDAPADSEETAAGKSNSEL